MTNWDPYARLLTAVGASMAVDRPYPTIRRWISEGKLKPFATQGTKKFYLESDVIALDAITLGPHPRRAMRGQLAAAKRRPHISPAVQRANAIFRAEQQQEKKRTTVVCLMPGCTMTRSHLPELHLCDEHLTIVHDSVDRRTTPPQKVRRPPLPRPRVVSPSTRDPPPHRHDESQIR